MKQNIFSTKTIGALVMAGLFAFASCSSDDNSGSEPTKPEETNKTSYAVLTATLGVQPFVGYLTNYAKMPEGNLDNIQKGSLQVKGNGIKAYGEWVFQRLQLGRTSSPDDGILRYTINPDGSLVESGRITGMSSNFYVHDKTTGYYADAGRSLLKLQIFNPSTMQRTGEIDLSAVEDKKAEYQAVGTNFIAAKEGKLYVDIITGTQKGKGNGMTDPARGYVQIAVIDIATAKYEKTIKDTRISFVGYPGNANQMWSTGEDGALYICSHGFGVDGSTNGSAIVRIKKGTTDFDNKWIVNVNDYMKDATVGSVTEKGGKLYTAWGDKAFVYGDILGTANFTYYAFDKENIAAGPKAVEGIPASTYAFQDAQAISTIDGKVYFRVVNNKDYNGYYVLGSDNVAKPAFNIGKGGNVWGLVKLVK